MIRLPNIVTAAFAVVIVTSAYAHAAPAGSQIVAPQGETTLTLTAAKQLVSAQLAASGQRWLRPGAAEFDAAGNVDVRLVNVQGLPVGHILVRPNSGAVTDAHAAGKPGANG